MTPRSPELRGPERRALANSRSPVKSRPTPSAGDRPCRASPSRTVLTAIRDGGKAQRGIGGPPGNTLSSARGRDKEPCRWRELITRWWRRGVFEPRSRPDHHPEEVGLEAQPRGFHRGELGEAGGEAPAVLFTAVLRLLETRAQRGGVKAADPRCPRRRRHWFRFKSRRRRGRVTNRG